MLSSKGVNAVRVNAEVDFDGAAISKRYLESHRKC
jgi:hypothetical protein